MNKGEAEEYPYRYKYWRPAVAADNIVLKFDGKQLQVLLVRRKNEPFKDMWAFPGGFMQQNETLQETALRELKEETALVPIYTEELCSRSAPDRDPREHVVSVVFYSLVRAQEPVAGDDAAEVQWFNIYELPPLAFDHEEIMQKAIETIRIKVRFTPNFFYLLDEYFTLSDLQRLLSSIFNRKFDRRNFQKHWISLSLLTNIISPVKVNEKSSGKAKYFKYNEKEYIKSSKKMFC